MQRLENGAICTCNGGGGCAYHDMGDAGTYRKSFEQASRIAEVEHDRADEAERKRDIYHEKHEKLAHHVYAAFPQHKSEGPWGAVACAARQISDLETDLRNRLVELRQNVERQRDLVREVTELQTTVITLARLLTEAKR